MNLILAVAGLLLIVLYYFPFFWLAKWMGVHPVWAFPMGIIAACMLGGVRDWFIAREKR